VDGGKNHAADSNVIKLHGIRPAVDGQVKYEAADATDKHGG
jgi:hypothetical protein